MTTFRLTACSKQEPSVDERSATHRETVEARSEVHAARSATDRVKGDLASNVHRAIEASLTKAAPEARL